MPLQQQPQPQPLRDFYAHRSGHETNQYCPRKGYLAYRHLGTGINRFPPIYFEIGTVVHAGLAHILANHLPAAALDDTTAFDAVDIAIAAFRDSLIYPTLKEYERLEQETLIEGMLWTFWFRVWPTFIGMFEVLYVEIASEDVVEDGGIRLHILSRPDAIVRVRSTGEIVGINWKTINSLTDERRQKTANSLQINMEAYYGERKYNELANENWVPAIPAGLRGLQLAEWLETALEEFKAQNKELAYSQLIYLVKGNRQLLLADGTEVPNETAEDLRDVEKFWRQDSRLCYRWVDVEGGAKTPAIAHSYRYYKAGNKSYNQLTKGYRRQPIWESGESVRDWVKSLHEGKVFPSTLAVDDDRNKQSALDDLVVFEAPVYRDVERQLRLLNQFIAAELRTVQSVMRVEKAIAGAPEALDDALDVEFPQHLINCTSPVRCEFNVICNAEAEARQPLFNIMPEGGQWYARVPHHKAEFEALGNGVQRMNPQTKSAPVDMQLDLPAAMSAAMSEILPKIGSTSALSAPPEKSGPDWGSMTNEFCPVIGTTPNVHEHENGWWWIDETANDEYGPFKTREAAAASLKLYASEALNAAQ